ncbi:xanthine dehydrogenase small subunit [Kordiimonas aestuarii]|uniref:xanthine dehydrogenase small subunit n=1 Tax=Kordiimonas aestuarii TaxID=1005925 RepID=UPI0021CF354B|nr:xanthine dehydrogenase small subunit [Kordiimonas aestuarii]
MTETVRFLLDGEYYELTNPDPTTTVLNFLRYELARTGTKEGCAEGDCGACTVVLGELIDGRIRCRAVNACILFVPTLDGKELITVESLRAKDGTLHPVQQALVDTHGSQCGFCTPGFVMSLYALYEEGGARGRAHINDALAGNLCRCTGYGPIVEAGLRMEEMRLPVDAGVLKDRVDALRSLKRHDTLKLSVKDKLTGTHKYYFAPVTIDGLADISLAYPDATYLAGGTDVGLWVTKQHRELAQIIYIGDVEELKHIQVTDRSVEIGAGASFTDAIDVLARYYGDMGEIIRRIGSVQIRNSGTLGGNIANGSPIGDSMPALIAAGATLTLRMGSLERTMPLEDYFIDYGKQDLQPGEFVARISVPLPPEHSRYRAYKVSKRFDQDISAVCACFGFEIKAGVMEGARIAYGGMTATPKRAAMAERALVGRAWTMDNMEAAVAALAEDFAPISDMRASADYRMMAAQNLLRKAFIELDAEAETRLVGDRELGHA